MILELYYVFACLGMIAMERGLDLCVFGTGAAQRGVAIVVDF